MCGATTKRSKPEEVSVNQAGLKHAKRFDFELSLGFVDSTSLVHASRSCTSLRHTSHRAAKTMVLSLVDFFVANGDVEFTHGIACKRADVETWCGLLHSLQFEPHEVTLSAYVAERFDASISHSDIVSVKHDISESAGLGKICERYGFSEVFSPEKLNVGERTICPYDGLQAHVLTYTCPSTSVAQACKFGGALRSALSRRVKAGRLARYRVDGWGSWRLTPLLRYENYFDFDADVPFRFHLSVPPYHCLASKWVLGSPLSSSLSPTRRSLVLDLDETLIHTEVEPIHDADFSFTLSSHEGSQKMFVRIRPHAKHFLAEVAKHFEVIVFTASERPYAEHVLKNLDPTGALVEHVLCREDCTYIEGEFVKDLGSLKRDLSDVVLVDNRPEMYCYHADNGIPISSWFEDRRDCELLRLMPSLARLTSPLLSDVRSYVRHHWRTFEHVRRVSIFYNKIQHHGQNNHHDQEEEQQRLIEYDIESNSPTPPPDTPLSSPFIDSLQSPPDWLGNDLGTEVEVGEGVFYNADDAKGSLFSIGSRPLNNHYFFNDDPDM